MSSSSSSPIDPFGVGDNVSRDMADLEMQAGEVASKEAVDRPARKLGPGGIPMPAVIGIGVFAAFLIIVILIAVIAKVGGGDGRQVAVRAEAARNEALEAAQQVTLRTQVQELQDAVRVIRDEQLAIAQQLKRGLASQDVQGVEQRVVRTETALRQLGTDVASVVRRVGDSQPFEAQMFVREDIRIVSIGNGIARVVDQSGREFNLQRGDRWDGLRVTKIRADRRQITFSDGSVAS